MQVIEKKKSLSIFSIKTNMTESDATVMAITFAKTISRIAEFAVDLAETLHKDLGLQYNGPTSNKKPSKKRSRSEKDPNEPKRPPTAYMLYSAHIRDEYKTKGEAMPQLKDIADMWGKLGESEKEKFNRDAQSQKDIYDKQMTEYKSSKDSTNNGVVSGNKTDSSDNSDSDLDDVPPPKMQQI
jgi:hypothetical protein